MTIHVYKVYSFIYISTLYAYKVYSFIYTV